MRALLATVLLFLFNLQPLAGGALCLRHHEKQNGGACEAAMQSEMDAASHHRPVDDEGGMPPMTDDCATAMACAAPAPVAAGTITAIDFAAPLLQPEARPQVAPRPDVSAATLFRPPIA